MNEATELKAVKQASAPVEELLVRDSAKTIHEHIVEIVSDSGEGAQKCGQTFGKVSAQMGNGIWTVEIIPAEIQPPARTMEGASGIRIRVGESLMTNMGNDANLVIAFNDQVLRARVASGGYNANTIILLDNMWATDPDEDIRKQYSDALLEFDDYGYEVVQLPIQEECLKIVPDPRKGKNMFVLGMLCHIYSRDVQKGLDEITKTFERKGEAVVESNHALFTAGYKFAYEKVDYHYKIPVVSHSDKPMVVMSGNQALGLGVMASGMELVSMYPITPATSASHQLADDFHLTGGFVHQAEDEIAAAGFAIGASYAGKTACTITSGPGIALKTEMIGLTSMAEIPIVIVDVQRGGPSTGLPTKVEQSDLLSVLFGSAGDSPKVVLAAATISECFEFVTLARKLAESFRTPVIILTDANLATGVQPFERPDVTADWLAAPIDQSEWDESTPAYDWDEETGLSTRPIPGMRGGEYVVTGLAHNRNAKIAYDSANNQETHGMRSRKLAVLAQTLTPPKVHGDPEGDLLVVSWGSTLGTIEEAVDVARENGHKVSSVHLRFLSPLEPGLKEIFAKFKKVMTIEINYSDDVEAPYINSETRRYAQLAQILRAHTLLDIGCWSAVSGHPLQPGAISRVIIKRVEEIEGGK